MVGLSALLIAIRETCADGWNQVRVVGVMDRPRKFKGRAGAEDQNQSNNGRANQTYVDQRPPRL